MLELEVFVGKLFAIDAFSARPIGVRKVTALQHELRNDAMENTSFEMQGFPHFSDPFLTGAQASKILDGFGDIFAKQSHHNPTGIFVTDRNIKINLRRDFSIARRFGKKHGG
jgi:hypothetical protein